MGERTGWAAERIFGSEGRHRGILAVQFLVLPFLILFLSANICESLLSTIGLLLLVCFWGTALIRKSADRLGDPHITLLAYVYVTKLCVMVLVLYAGWVPMLDPSSPIFGYDPQRYYFLAKELAQNGFGLNVWPELTYKGILFYYGVVFEIFGQNPVIPALINAFLTLLATLLLLKVGYKIKKDRGPDDWLLGLGMLIPEVLWFDGLTAREPVCMALITIVVLSVADVLLRRPDERQSVWQFLAAIFAFMLIGPIRASMMVPTFVVVLLLMAIFAKRVRGSLVSLVSISTAITVLVVLIPVFGAGIFITKDFDLLKSINIFLNVESVKESIEFGERSLGFLFLMDTPLKVVAYAPIRILIYLAAPLPNIFVDIGGLARRDWLAYQQLFTGMTSVLYMTAFPLLFASLVEGIRAKEKRDFLFFQLPFWVLIFAISMGVQIIHERYRVMVALLLWGCIWLGKSSDPRTLRCVYAGWLGFLAAGGTFFLYYKYLY